MTDLSKVDDVYAALIAFGKVKGFKRGKKKGKKLQDAFLKKAGLDPQVVPEVVRSLVIPWLDGTVGEPYIYPPSGSVRYRTPGGPARNTEEPEAEE